MKARLLGASMVALLVTGLTVWLLRSGGSDDADPAVASASRGSLAEPADAEAAAASRGASLPATTTVTRRAPDCGAGATRLVWGRVAAASRGASLPATTTVTRRTPDCGAGATRLVWGRVAAEGRGQPIADAEVRLFDYARDAERTVRTDASGSFAFPETRDRDGLFRLAISHPGFGSPLQADVRPVPEPAIYELPPGGVIRGRVVQAVVGSPVPRYTIQVVPFPETDRNAHRALLQQVLPQDLCVAAAKDVDEPDGKFELVGLRAGKLALIVKADGFQPMLYHGGSGVEAKPADAAEPCLIELPAVGDLFLRVLDAESKESILGAELDLLVRTGGWRLPCHQRLDRLDADGRHRIRVAMTPERSIRGVDLTVTRPGYVPWSASLSGQPEGHTVVAVLGRGGRVRGTVRGDDRSPVAGCLVLAENGDAGELLATARTSADGTYELGPLPAETELVLHYFAPGLANLLAEVPLELREGEVRTVDIGASAAAAIFGRVTMRGAPIALVLVCLDERNPGAPGAGPRVRRRTMVYTGADGRFRLDGLAPGDYAVFFNADHEGRSLYAERFVVLVERQAQELSIAFGRVIRGLVIDAETDQPLPAKEAMEVAARRAARPEDRDSESVPIGDGGRFTMYVTEPALYELWIPDSERWFMENSPVVDLRTASEVEVQLRVRQDPRNGKITFRVVDDATGQPVGKGSYRFSTQRTQRVGGFTDGVIEDTECEMGTYRFVIRSDDHPPAIVQAAITRTEKAVDREVRLLRGAAVRVTEVTPGGNGWNAGLRPGDVIRTCGGTPIRGLTALHAAIDGAPKDAPVRLDITRSGTPMTLSAARGPLEIEAEACGETR